MKRYIIIILFLSFIKSINGVDLDDIKSLKFMAQRTIEINNDTINNSYRRKQMRCSGCLCNEIKINEINCINTGIYPYDINTYGISDNIDILMWKCYIDIIGYKLSNASIFCSSQAGTYIYHDLYGNIQCGIDYMISPVLYSDNNHCFDKQYTMVNYTVCSVTTDDARFSHCTSMGRLIMLCKLLAITAFIIFFFYILVRIATL
jgi:hypothetical protein